LIERRHRQTHWASNTTQTVNFFCHDFVIALLHDDINTPCPKSGI